jgi:hypothetical protein
MATTTPKLGLIKPDFVDVVDVSELNDNMDVLDDALTDSSTLDDLSGVDLTSPVAGEKLVFDGTNWVNLEGYVFVETVYFTSSGTFTKASYPWLRAVRVKCQGAGAGGGGGDSSSTRTLAGGSGGNYSESFITDIAGLDASVTVTRGAGGAGGADTGSSATAGSNGGASSFGTVVVASGGLAGTGAGSSVNNSGNTGDLIVLGDSVIPAVLLGSTNGSTPGGSSRLGTGGDARGSAAGTSIVGQSGFLYGGGGGGARVTSGQPGRTGGAGANGIVIVELFA